MKLNFASIINLYYIVQLSIDIINNLDYKRIIDIVRMP